MITPHWYQGDCLTAIARARRRGRINILFTMASGLGKTVTVALDAFEFLKTHPHARFLYLCHKNEILDQACATYQAIHGSNHSYGLYNGLDKAAPNAKFLFASLQTMRTDRSRFRPDGFDYVAVDESHHTYADTYLDVVNYWKPKTLVGMTATPDRTDGQDIRRVFGKEVFLLPLDDALAQDLLTPVDYRFLSDEIQLGKCITTPERRLGISSLNRLIFIPKRDEEIAKIINRHAKDIKDPRIIVFCESVAHCNRFARHVEGAMPFHSKISPGARIVQLEMFRQGMLRSLVTRDVFNEGIDIPQANMLVFLRCVSSSTIFFQQLGRGLRKSNGKDKVIALDFVGNCERIKMVVDLWERVQKKRKDLLELSSRESCIKDAPRPFNIDHEPLTLNIDSKGFREKIIPVLDIIRRKIEGYTGLEVIQWLKALAGRLGRSPTQVEVHADKRAPSLSSINGLFGNFSKALKAAGLSQNQIVDTPRNVLIQQLKDLEALLKRSPSQRDVNQASKEGRCNCEPVFRKEFGSLNKALQAAGLKPTRLVGLSKKELIVQLKKLGADLGRTPTVDDLGDSKDTTVSQTVFCSRFGTWNKALKAAGFTPNHVMKEFRKCTKEEALEQLLALSDSLGRLPVTSDIPEASIKGLCPSVSTIYKHFGNIRKLHNALIERKK